MALQNITNLNGKEWDGISLLDAKKKQMEREKEIQKEHKSKERGIMAASKEDVTKMRWKQIDGNI